MKVFVLPNLQLSLASWDLPSCGDSLMDGIMRLRGVLIPQGLGGSSRGYERPRWSRFQQVSANSHFGTTPSQRRLVQPLGYFWLLSVGVQVEKREWVGCSICTSLSKMCRANLPFIETHLHAHTMSSLASHGQEKMKPVGFDEGDGLQTWAWQAGKADSQRLSRTSPQTQQKIIDLCL